jgi:hypothetical protein
MKAPPPAPRTARSAPPAAAPRPSPSPRRREGAAARVRFWRIRRRLRGFRFPPSLSSHLSSLVRVRLSEVRGRGFWFCGARWYGVCQPGCRVSRLMTWSYRRLDHRMRRSVFTYVFRMVVYMKIYMSTFLTFLEFNILTNIYRLIEKEQHTPSIDI